MKYVAILFNLYMILLILMPCQDVADAASVSEVRLSAQKKTDTAQHCGDEQCPPFCSCACCSTGRYFPLPAHPGPAEILLPVSYTVLNITALKTQPAAIWQPPKLA